MTCDEMSHDYGDWVCEDDYWFEEETENEARDRMTPEEPEADEAFDPFAEEKKAP